jgi:hypothetical protein
MDILNKMEKNMYKWYWFEKVNLPSSLIKVLQFICDYVLGLGLPKKKRTQYWNRMYIRGLVTGDKELLTYLDSLYDPKGSK